LADRLVALRWARPLLVVVAGTALAGCGGGTKADSLPTVVQAARATLSASASSTLSLDGASAFGAPHAALQGQGQFGFQDGIGYQSVDVAGGRVTVVYAPQRVYLQPTVETLLPPTKEWVAATVPASGRVSGDIARFVEQAEGLSPALLLHEVVWGGQRAGARGHTTVNHVRLARYDVTVDLSRAAAKAAHQSPAEHLAIEQELAAAPRVQVTVLIDGSGRVARMEATTPGAGLGPATVDLTRLNYRFASGPPPDGQVSELSALAGSYASTVRSPWARGAR